MPFNSFLFILGLLPITLIVFFALAKRHWVTAALTWLLLISIWFYGSPQLAGLPLLGLSIVLNYLCGQALEQSKFGPGGNRLLLGAGLAFNLGTLAYFKYTGFFISILNQGLNLNLAAPQIWQPLAISFFSFTQIAYLVDAYRGQTQSSRSNWLTYTLFVTFFPKLLAGPIVRYNEFIPQLQRLQTFVFSPRNFATGLTLFTLGLAKKVLIADNLAPQVALVFNHANQVSLIEAWVGALSYTLQLYFDFSGYSDMAIAVGLMLNLQIPTNFNSPYKALSITDFWRRWHITLSNFLRDYLYIPLGGSRQGNRYVNLTFTMLLGGLWHGAGWPFIVWGGLHGLYLSINHWWRQQQRPLPGPLAWLLTFSAVLVSWVFFRATTLADAGQILQAMVGLKGITLSQDFGFLQRLAPLGLSFTKSLVYLDGGFKSVLVTLALLPCVLFLPNTQELIERFKPTWWTALILSGLATYCLVSLNRVSEFLYFQF